MPSSSQKAFPNGSSAHAGQLDGSPVHSGSAGGATTAHSDCDAVFLGRRRRSATLEDSALPDETRPDEGRSMPVTLRTLDCEGATGSLTVLAPPRLASSLIIRQTHVSLSVQKPQSTSTSSAVVRVDDDLSVAAEGRVETSKPGPDKIEGDVRW